MRKHKNNSGFTLVELSIVLVIIGLIIGGVLTGRQIMRNAQVTNTINGLQAFEAQFQTYVQNYNAMPGDDANASTHFSGLGTSDNGSGSGTLQGAFDSTTSTDETSMMWGVLRAAGLVKGASGNNAQPTNVFGGVYGFQHGAFTGTGVFTTNVICINDVPGDAAEAIDERLDDGVSNTGAVMAEDTTAGGITGASATVATSYVSGDTYTMCVKM